MPNLLLGHPICTSRACCGMPAGMRGDGCRKARCWRKQSSPEQGGILSEPTLSRQSTMAQSTVEGDALIERATSQAERRDRNGDVFHVWQVLGRGCEGHQCGPNLAGRPANPDLRRASHLHLCIARGARPGSHCRFPWDRAGDEGLCGSEPDDRCVVYHFACRGRGRLRQDDR